MNDSSQAGRTLEILVGLVCGVIGVGLLILGALVAYKGVEHGATTDSIFLVGLPIMAGLGAFFALISYRLVLNRGAKVGNGLLSPIGWKVTGTIFAGLAVFLAIAAIWQAQWGMLAAPLFAFIFAKWCFYTAKVRSVKTVPDSTPV